MPALAKPHRIAFLVPDVSIDGPDAPFERAAAALLWTACIEACQRHPRLAVLDPDATPLLPQDGQFVPKHAERGGRPNDAFFAPTRRDEVLWLELSLSGKRFWWGTNPQQQTDFLEMSNALTWQHGSDIALTVYQDWSDNPLIQGEGNLGEHLYGAVEAQWKPRPSMVLRAFYGAYKAGIHCSGGQCRSLPGFDGAKLSFTGTF